MSLMKGKRGLIVGIANDHSIAWGIAKKVASEGARTALTFQSDALGKRVKPLAEIIKSELCLPLDVEDIGSVDKVFAEIEKAWGGLDFLVHAVAFSDKSELKGRYCDTTRANFQRTLQISCFSFVELAQRAAKIMPPGGSMITLSFDGAVRVMPNYNVMGVAKAALESSTRYLAADFGPQGIRVNAISSGPIRTLAGAGITDARVLFSYMNQHSLLRRGVSIDEIGSSAMYLLSDLSSGVTGEIHYVDSGYNVVAMPKPSRLKEVNLLDDKKAAE